MSLAKTRAVLAGECGGWAGCRRRSLLGATADSFPSPPYHSEATSGCKAWTFSKDHLSDVRCYYKSSASGRVYSYGMVSGYPTTAPTPSPSVDDDTSNSGGGDDDDLSDDLVPKEIARAPFVIVSISAMLLIAGVAVGSVPVCFSFFFQPRHRPSPITRETARKLVRCLFVVDSTTVVAGVLIMYFYDMIFWDWDSPHVLVLVVTASFGRTVTALSSARYTLVMLSDGLSFVLLLTISLVGFVNNKLGTQITQSKLGASLLAHQVIFTQLEFVLCLIALARYKEFVLEGLCTKANARLTRLSQETDRLSAVVTNSTIQEEEVTNETTEGYVNFDNPTDGAMLCAENADMTLLGTTASMHLAGKLGSDIEDNGGPDVQDDLTFAKSVESVQDDLTFAKSVQSDDPEAMRCSAMQVRWTGIGAYRWDGFHLLVNPNKGNGKAGSLDEPLIGTVTPAHGTGWKYRYVCTGLSAVWVILADDEVTVYQALGQGV